MVWSYRNLTPLVLQRAIANFATTFFRTSGFLRKFLGGDFALDTPYTGHPWYYAAVNAIVRNVKRVPIKLMTGPKKDPVEVEEPHPWLTLLNRPNDTMTWPDLIESTIVHRKNTGAVFWVKMNAMGGRVGPREVPRQLWPVTGDAFRPEVEIVKTDSGMMERFVAWVMTTGTGSEMRLAPHEVVIFRHMDPQDRFGWMSPANAARRSIRRDIKADIYDNSFFENAVNLSGIITVKEGTHQDTKDDIAKDWDDQHAGQGKNFKIAVVEGAESFVSTTGTRKDMEWLAMREFGRDVALGILGVPKSEVGLEDGVNMITGAGALSTNKNFWERSLDPEMSDIERSVTERLFRDPAGVPIAGDVRLEFAREEIPALQPDMSRKILDAQELVDLGLTFNEAMEHVKLKTPKIPAPLGDTRFLSFDRIPADQILNGGGSSEDDDDDPLSDIDDPETEGARVGHEDDDDDDEPTEEEKEALYKYWKLAAKKHIFPLESSFKKVWRKHVNSLGDATVARLQSANLDSDESVRAALFDVDEWSGRARDVTRSTYRKAARSALSRLKEDFGVEGKISNDRMNEMIRARQRELDRSHRVMRRDVRRAVNRGRAENETNEQLVARAKKVFSQRSKRAGQQALEQVNGIQNRATMDVYRQNDIRQHIWVTNPTAGKGGPVRTTHVRNNGVKRKIGREWRNGLRYPRDPRGSMAEICGCRCFTNPVTRKSKKNMLRIIRRAIDRMRR